MHSSRAISNEYTSDEQQSRLFAEAEKEMSSFVSAVQNLFGGDQARQSADDWISGLESYSHAAGSGDNPWRAVTIAAAARLADRVCLVRPTDNSTSASQD